MAVRLRLTLKSIPWFLIFKAVVFGAAWLFLPFGFFLLIAIYFYFFPPFQVFRLKLPFILTMASAVIFEKSFATGAVLSLIFYLILGIKDLIFIKRVLAYKVMTVVLILVVVSSFFMKFSSWGSLRATFWPLVLAAIFFLVGKDLYDYEEFSKQGIPKFGKSEKLLVFGILGLIGLEFAFLLLFLPLSFYYQTALFSGFSIVILALTMDYLHGLLVRKKFIISLSFLFVFFVFILASTEWAI